MPGCITLVSRLLETFDLAACWKVMPLGHGCEALSAKVLWKQDRRAWRQICHHSKIQTVKQTMWAQLTAHFTPLRNDNEQKWTSMMFQLPVSFPHLFLFPQRPGRVERLFFSSLQGTCRPTPGRGPWSFARCPARPTEDVPLFLFDWDGQTSPQAVNQPGPTPVWKSRQWCAPHFRQPLQMKVCFDRGLFVCVCRCDFALWL